MIIPVVSNNLDIRVKDNRLYLFSYFILFYFLFYFLFLDLELEVSMTITTVTHQVTQVMVT